ncbi:unnamed protein product, partial [Albugo candida]
QLLRDKGYAKKRDIIQAVVEYIRECNRPFRVMSSDKRRNKAVCTQHGCFFVVREGISITYMDCAHALKKLKLELYGCDIDQYSLISSYMAVLANHRNKLLRCGICNHFGHNRRTYPKRDA